MSRRFPLAFLLPLVAAALLAACDGEKVDYANSDRYDIKWFWQAGESGTAVSGVYGSLGVVAPDNHPGSRNGAVSWRGTGGSLFMFGGEGRDADGVAGALGDLWKSDGVHWVWAGGSATANTWGVYGTKGVAAATNIPGARAWAVSWTDATGNLWLFGGQGYGESGAAGRLNDLWKFDGTQWTWIDGAKTVDAAGVYGAQGVPEATNWPGARADSAGWIDAEGQLWLFGGNGRDSLGATGLLNDLWKYSGERWTWVRGDATADAPATYGTQATPGAANTPSGRKGVAAWFDAAGKAWIYGGEAQNADGRVVLNELWQFDGTSWAWVAGTKGEFTAPDYGARGGVALVGTPGSRYRPTAWVAPSGTTASTLWLFGGDVEAVAGTVVHPNDLWRYDSGYWSWIGGKSTDNPAGTYDAIGLAGQPGGRAGAAPWIDTTTQRLWLFGGGDHADLWSYGYAP